MSACYHCGEPVDESHPIVATLAGEERSFCCLGCEAVAQTIVGAGMGAYYRNRAEVASRASGKLDDFPAQWYDRDDVSRQFVSCSNALSEITLVVDDIRCGACAWLIESQLSHLAGMVSAQVNVSQHRLRVVWDARQLRLSTIIESLRSIGYSPHPFDNGQQQQLREQERKRQLRRISMAGLGMMQVMMYAYPDYIAAPGEIDPEFSRLMRWASLVLTLPAVFYSAIPFYRGALRGLKAKHPGMDLPVSLGILLAFISSVVATLLGRGDVYFDSVTMFIFFLLTGRYLEQNARQKSLQAAESLVHPLPAIAHRITPTGEENLPATALNEGDRILVRPGETIPADAQVLEGASAVDESLLTGESRPQPKRAGDSVIGGTLNLEGPLNLQVKAVGAQSVLSGMMRLMDRALTEKPAIASLADRVASHFILTLLGLMVLVALWWGWHDPSRVIPIAVAMLVVSCPCALSLATPVAVAAATTRAMKQGILVTRGHALETLARATHFVFDKTGTLTQGQLSLESVTALGSLTNTQCIELAALLESGSEHPIAQAITRAQGKALVHGGCRNFPGQGVEAEIDGVCWRLGKFDFVQELSPVQSLSVPVLNPGETPVWLGNTKGMEARLCFSDTLRPEAESLLQGLRRQGIGVSLMSGDEPAVVEQLARRLGVSHFEGGMSPQRKLEAIGQLQAEGKVVAMVGDGINDAAGLAGAQVSIALGRAADSVQKSADMVILKPSLQPLADAHELSRRMMTIIRQNLAWAFVYNVTAIPLAAMGMVPPWLAGLGMSLSSLLVVLNALRLGSDRKAKIG